MTVTRLYPASAKEHRSILATRASSAFTEAELMIAHLAALGVNTARIADHVAQAKKMLLILAEEAITGGG